MRSHLLTCIAVVAVSLCPRLVPEVCAKSKSAGKAQDKHDRQEKASATELHADDKSMKKQMQWEDKVMGPDSTRADLARLARAHALNEKAIKERDAQAAREAASPPPPVVAKAAAKRAEVALPSVSDGAKPSDGDKARPHEISAKLGSDEAKAPVPAAKPADDRFIDKLLRDEQASTASSRNGGGGAKKGSSSDRDLDRLLAGANEKRAGRADDVDKLLKRADSGPAMPAPRAPSALPAWTQQPDIAPSPPPVAVAPVAVAPTPRPRPARAPAARSTAASTWSDPFADSSTGSSASVTTRRAAAARPAAAAGAWSDPFADKSDAKPTRRSSPAAPAPASGAKHGDKSSDSTSHPAGWKDPFTKAPSAPSATPVAMRELGGAETARWELAAHHPKVASADAHQGWGVLKKRAR